ncbi:hypothetical protein DWV16_17015 [Anaerotruncus sp. AF02-27]|uniref:hypothetical protein n=1 Tax=Anaerotruncus TaxID=244127 RepID=UPI000E482FAF|nr:MULTISPECIES: hypothetical protein [Anaerotruncus]RGX53321.1 hypothetical protein DWV16_17015 [Anaerotruncus sp. AF02-27]
MLLGLMKGIAIFYYWTWFIWPFVFVFSLAVGIAEIVKDEKASGKSLIISAVSLLIILAGLLSPAFG